MDSPIQLDPSPEIASYDNYATQSMNLILLTNTYLGKQINYII
jgi:hypothetical protein